MKKNVITVGIISQKEYKQRTIAIAKGDYRPSKHEPKIWFESLHSMAQILNKDNQKLLEIILEKKPDSLRELAEVSGRKESNLSRTLRTMSRYGIVDLIRDKKAIKPIVKATDFRVEFGLNTHYQANA